MAGSIYLASTFLMGLLVVGVVALMVRGRRWHHYTPQAAYGKLSAGGGGPASAVSRLANTPSVWTATFLVLVLGIMAGVIVSLGGGGEGGAVVSGTMLIAGLGVIVVAYLVGGVYVAMRGNGRPRSQAVAGSVLTLGALLLVGITLRLVLSG